MLILHEPVCGSTSYARLQLVPRELHNILFIPFHTNAIGGHLNAYRTLHQLRLCFYWPGMYGYIKSTCLACPGCALSNPTRGKSSELVYNFPIEAPFLVIHFNAYVAGKHAGFEGSDAYLIGACGMCGFACMEPITNPSATTFASAIMRILLRYGFCHMAVLDKDSKFLAYVPRHWTFYKLIVTSFPVLTTTPCSLSVSINISIRPCGSCVTSAILSG